MPSLLRHYRPPLHRPLLALILLILSFAAAAQPPAAAVASAHPLATEAGLEVLRKGGNAFDAAVAVAAALAVVEPYGSGLGGGGFFLLHRAADGHQVVVDARETAPLDAHAGTYLDAAGQPRPRASLDGPLAAAIPGTPAALEHLSRRYGALTLETSLAPAIRLAEEGFVVDEHYRRMAAYRLQALRADPEARRIFLLDGEVPPAGWRLRQPELAETLRRIAAQGASGFYHGPVAQRLVAGVRAGGGIWRDEDLARYRIEERPPLVGHYRGMRVVSAPPPSAGGVGLITMLNILDGYRLETLSPAQRIHLTAEAMRRAYRDRSEHLGDPAFTDIPLARLLSPDYAAGLRAGIHPERAGHSALLAPPAAADTAPGEHTTHFSILDGEGNRVAATLSINTMFGAAFVPPGTGVLLNNEMDDFATRPGGANLYGLVESGANAIAPGKRPLSSMAPTFLESGERIAILGTPGGSRIVTMVLLAALEFAAGGDAEALVARPRFHHQYLPDQIQHEPNALTPEVQERLRAMGHELKDIGRRYGDMQVVLWDCRRNQVQAASDPRGIGAARTLAVRAAPRQAACR